MRKIFLLVKTIIKSGGGGMSAGKKARSRIVLPIVLVFAFISFAGPMALLTSGIYDTLVSASVNPGVILPLVFGATCAVIFIFGVIYVISVMYHAADIELLSYLPIKPYEILSAKFITLIIYEYIFEAFILLPVIYEFGVKSGGGIPYIIYSVILFLITPCIALSMAAVLVIILMRFTNIAKNKQAFRFIISILVVLFAIGLNVFAQMSVKNISESQLAAALQSSTLPSMFNGIFPGIGFASGALTQSGSMGGLVNLILFILCSAAAFAVFLLIGQLLYEKGVSGVTEVTAKRKGVQDLGRETESLSAFNAYVRKEIKLLFRSPTAFINCVLMTFIWPVLLLVGFMSGGSGKLSQLAGMISSIDSAVLIAILAGISAFISCAIPIASTAISREGKSLYFTKYIPMSMRSQINAKIVPGMIFSSVSVVLIIIIGFFIGVDVVTGIVSIIIGLVIMAAGSYIGLLLDIANPKLTWINEQQAIKQNLNVVLHMLIGIVLGAVAIVPPIIFGMTAVISVIYNLAVFSILLVILAKYTRTRGVKKLIDMDV